MEILPRILKRGPLSVSHNPCSELSYPNARAQKGKQNIKKRKHVDCIRNILSFLERQTRSS